jgi:hypothetical protein
MSAVTEQVIAISTSAQECPICMDTIEGLCNRVVTECGHAFHCSCLMQNAAHNGFGCPYCRTKMAEEPEEEDDEEDEESIEEDTVFESDALTSFRMFHQRINGEEVEEDEADEWATVDGDEEDEEEEEQEEEEDNMPDAAYMAQKLAARGITFEDLVKNILFQEHSNWGENYTDYERRSSEVFGQFRAVISQYTPSEPTPAPAAPAPVVTSEPAQVAIPVVAESKSAAIPRRREFIVHV